MTAWHESHDNIVLLCRYLVEERGVDYAWELLDVIAEPWKWEAEFNEAQRHFATGPNS